jgi:hypothetical protein
MHSAEGIGHKFLPLAIAFYSVCCGAWCSYEAHKGVLEEMKK